MQFKKRILIVDDHAILRDGLRSILEVNGEFDVVAEAGDGAEALARCQDSKPDLVLLDLTLPGGDGFNLLREMKRRSPKILVMVFTMHNNQQYCKAAIASGADGYCLKDTPVKELLLAMHEVCDGRKYVSTSLGDPFGKGLTDASAKQEAEAGQNQYDLNLTSREKEIIRLVAQGFTNAQIGETLFISDRTVDNHCTNIRNKLDIHSKQAMAAFAFRSGLLD